VKGIEIPIGAPLGQLDSDLKGAKSKLSAFTADQVKAAGGLDAFKRAANSGGQSLQNFAKGTNSANFALTNFGRVAQDAPFGFIGIQNNLNPLLESFQRLKAETGSTGGALKALGSSLMGPAGLGIALSVVSAGILFYQQYQQKANKTTENAKKVNDDYAKSLGDVAQAQLVGAQSAASELTNLKVLYGQTQNTTLSLKQRIAASDELQSKYPAYFKNISDEAILAGGAAAKYNELSTAILASARARAGQDLITTNTKRQLENEQKIIDLKVEELKLTKSQLIAKNNLDKSSGSAGIGGSNAQGLAIALSKIEEKITANKTIQRNLATDHNILSERNLQLIKSINIESAKGTVLDGKKVGGASLSAKTKSVDDARFAREKKIGIERLNSLDTFLSKYRATEAELNKTPLIGFPPDFQSKLAVPFENLKLNILPQLQTSFQGFFDDILMRGRLSFESLGKSILSTFASVLANQATTGVLALLGDKGSQAKGNIFSTAFKALGLFGGKAAAAATAASAAASAAAAGSLAGVAASTGGVILGSGLAAGGTTAAALASGTVATGGLLLPVLAGAAALAGIATLFKKKQTPLPAQQTNSYSSAAISSNSDFGGGRVVFEISGTNLIGVLNRAGAKLQRFGP